MKNILNSGCLLFPVSLTCFETSWSIGNEQIEKYSNIVKSFARDTPERSRYTDFDYTINTFQWVLPWLKEYAFKNALIQISFFITLLSTIFLGLLKLIGKLNTIEKKFLLYCWFLIVCKFISMVSSSRNKIWMRVNNNNFMFPIINFNYL